jgi:Predicted membrane protein (DUF2306)
MRVRTTPVRSRREGAILGLRSSIGWAAVVVCVLFGLWGLAVAAGEGLAMLGSTEADPDRSAPPFFLAHAAVGGVALISGSLQLRLADRLLRPSRRVHRAVGRIYLWAARITSLGGLPVAASFDANLAGKLMFATESLLWFAATTIAYRRIRHGEVLEHRAWMIRSYALALFVVTFGILDPLFEGSTLAEDTGEAIAVFLSWSLNLAGAELWIRSVRPLTLDRSRMPRREERTTSSSRMPN